VRVCVCVYVCVCVCACVCVCQREGALRTQLCRTQHTYSPHPLTWTWPPPQMLTTTTTAVTTDSVRPSHPSPAVAQRPLAWESTPWPSSQTDWTRALQRRLPGPWHVAMSEGTRPCSEKTHSIPLQPTIACPTCDAVSLAALWLLANRARLGSHPPQWRWNARKQGASGGGGSGGGGGE
jgi:hypothetical protein